MGLINTPIRQYKVYYQVETKNISFIKMYNVLKSLGVKNNKFFLELKDPMLMNVDPHDERNLSIEMKARILREVQTNFWYFAREIVRIPVAGGEIGGGVQYALHRGNLAMNYCFLNDINSYTELPRQNYKSISTVVWYLWLYNFGTSNSEVMFMNKKHEDSKLNLKRVKDIRETLPSYLQFINSYNAQGKELKGNDNVEFIDNPKNGNKIVTKPSARTKASADGLGRGKLLATYYSDIVFNISLIAGTP